MGTPKRKALTYRVENIPKGTTRAQLVKNFFYTEDQDDLTVKSLCPSVESIAGEVEKELTATMLFRPREDRPNGPRVQDNEIDVDKDFLGFTPLYVPAVEKGSNDSIKADIIAVTGLAGHAYGSWARHDDKMWLRDYLKIEAPNARILTYGYSSELQDGSSSMLDDYAVSFFNALVSMRDAGKCEQRWSFHTLERQKAQASDSSQRPIIFIGHSLGCLLIKQVLIESTSRRIDPSRLPVRSIIFLGAPHRGLDVTALQTLVEGTPPQTMVTELKPGSPTLQKLNTGFKKIAQDIDILTLYETRTTKTVVLEDGSWKRTGNPVMMVDRDSATLFYPREKAIHAIANHSEIAKLKKGSESFTHVGYAIRCALRPTADIAAENFQSTSGGFMYQQAPQWISPPTSQCPTHQSPIKRFIRAGSQYFPFDDKVSDLDSEIVKAVKQDDSEALHVAVHKKKLLNARDDDRSTPLNLAAQLGRTSCVEILLGAGALENVRDRRHNTPLMNAVLYGHSEVVRVLLDNSVDVNHSGSDHGRTALSTAVALGQSDMVNLLLDKKAKIEVKHGPVLLSEAASRGDEKIMELLLNAGAKVDEETGANALITAALKGNEHIVNMLLSRNANVDWQDPEGYTCLHWAAKNGDLEICEVLVNHGAKLETKTKEDLKLTPGMTPLLLAAKCKHSPVVEFLLSREAEIDAMDCKGYTSLHRAARKGNLEICEVLVNHRANLESKTKEDLEFNAGMTPLLLASTYNHSPIVEFLLGHEAKVDAIDCEGYTSLHRAAEYGNLESCEALVNHCADLELKTRANWQATPLQLAAWFKHVSVVNFLLSRGAKINERDENGRTSLHNAAKKGLLTICEVLLQHDAAMDLKDKKKKTPLFLAIQNGHSDVVKLLLKHGVDPNRRWGTSFALHIAARYGDIDVLKVLVENGANLDMETTNGSNAVSGAAYEGKVDAVRFLLEKGASDKPPSDFHGDWKHQKFAESVDDAKQEEILGVIRSDKHE
ncbi:ankyrin repeat-containing domain protein [Phyllosticta capitalensis]